MNKFRSARADDKQGFAEAGKKGGQKFSMPVRGKQFNIQDVYTELNVRQDKIA